MIPSALGPLAGSLRARAAPHGQTPSERLLGRAVRRGCARRPTSTPSHCGRRSGLHRGRLGQRSLPADHPKGTVHTEILGMDRTQRQWSGESVSDHGCSCPALTVVDTTLIGRVHPRSSLVRSRHLFPIWDARGRTCWLQPRPSCGLRHHQLDVVRHMFDSARPPKCGHSLSGGGSFE